MGVKKEAIIAWRKVMKVEKEAKEVQREAWEAEKELIEVKKEAKAAEKEVQAAKKEVMKDQIPILLHQHFTLTDTERDLTNLMSSLTLKLMNK